MVRLETSPKMMGSPSAAAARTVTGIELEDDIGDAGLLEDVGQVLAVEPVTGDDDVVRRGPGRLSGASRPASSSGASVAPRSARAGETWMRSGVGQDGQDGRGEEDLEDVARQEAVGPSDAGQDEGELADLGQGQARSGGRSADPYPSRPTVRTTMTALRTRIAATRPRTVERNLQTAPDVEQHADGDEEQAVEDVLEGQDVGDDLMAVVGFGDEDPGQEGAQGQGQPERGRQQGHAQADEQRGDEEDLADAGLDDEVEDRGMR